MNNDEHNTQVSDSKQDAQNFDKNVYKFKLSEKVANQILSLKSFMGKEESRYVLCGISIEVKYDKIFAVSTNAKMLGVFYFDRNELENDMPKFWGDDASFIIPSSLIKKIKSPKGYILLSYNKETKEVEFRQNGTTFQEKAIDGQYPNWRGVVPELPYSPVSDHNWTNTENYVALHDFVKHFKKEESSYHLVNIMENTELLGNGFGKPLVFSADYLTNFLGIFMEARMKDENKDNVRNTRGIIMAGFVEQKKENK